jgi:MerR family transcriptional regulator, light-induced transcriptional regulator
MFVKESQGDMEADASYRIQAVARMTGVPAATLRAWERRYGFPSPARTASAYRLFSDSDVALLKRMRTLVQRGVAPNEAARSLLAAMPADTVAYEIDPYGEAVARMLDAIERFDVEGLELELRRALMLNSGSIVCERVLAPVLCEIGVRWQAGTLSVAHEHFASHLIGLTLLDLLRTTVVPEGAPTALLACFDEETHALPLYAAALAMSSWGYRPIMLGSRMPPVALSSAVASLSPRVVGLSVTVAPTSKSVARDLVDAYADACNGVPFVVGGAGATALAQWVEKRGGHIAPADLPSARKVVDLASRQRRSRR